MLPSIQIITDCIIYICILNCLTNYRVTNFKLFVIKCILGNIFFYLFFIRILLFKILNKFKHTVVKTLYIYYLKKIVLKSYLILNIDRLYIN